MSMIKDFIKVVVIVVVRVVQIIHECQEMTNMPQLQQFTYWFPCSDTYTVLRD